MEQRNQRNHWPTRSSQEMRFGMLRTGHTAPITLGNCYDCESTGRIFLCTLESINLTWPRDKLTNPITVALKVTFIHQTPFVTWCETLLPRLHKSSQSTCSFEKFPANRMISLTWNIPRCPENVCEVETHRKKTETWCISDIQQKSIYANDERRAR